MKTILDVQAANDDFAGQASAVPSGELIRDLLSQRIKVPAAPAVFLARPGLQKIIADALQPGRTLLLEAPAGYGKTQALREHVVAAGQERVAWLSVESRDNDPRRLMALLGIALGQDQRQALGSMQRDLYPDLLSLLLQRYAREFAEKPESLPTCLILDNVHWLTQPDARDMIEQMVAELPETLALVLISREQVTFSTHGAALGGRLARLGAENLRLSLAETEVLFAEELQQQRIRPADIEQMHHVSEGWITPLQLFRMELQGETGTPRTILESPAVARFFRDGLLGHYSTVAQVMLFHMAEPELISDALLQSLNEALFELELTPSMACQKGLPIWPVSGQGRWYRFNPLFRDWLLGRELHGRQTRALRASHWFEARGDRSEALTHALRAQDADRALEIAASGSEALLAGQNTGELLSWRQQLPAHLIEKSPRLRLVYGWVHAIGGQFSLAEKLIEGLPGAETDALGGRLMTLRAFILRGRGAIGPALEAVDQALADSSLSDHARLMALWIRSSALCAVERYAEARSANRHAARLARESGDPGSEILAVYDHARIELGKGYLKRAETLIRRGMDVALNAPYQPPRVGESRLQLSLALLLWHQGRWQEAETSLVRAARQAEHCRDLGLLMNLALRALIAKSRGELEQAFSWIGQAERTMQLWQVDDIAYRPVLEALKLSCWLQGDQLHRMDAALECLVTGDREPCVPELFPMLPGLVETLRIRNDIARGDLALAQERLAVYGQSMDGLELPLGRLIYARILQSMIHDKAGKPDKALVALREALQEAAREEYVSPFIEMESALRELLPKVLASAGELPFFDRLRSYFRVEKHQAAKAGRELVEPISDRERGVLELIAIGLSNQDIADRLHISLHTVKTHARRLNAKLGVRSRTQAIVRARELGVL
ncbi:helix-turn-helix transcriptional regulator [Marinobacter halodurans]|uniref:Helix-turn-helix transcriptional regulator n=1 Tax=Marinobacter halodurans TaxID=2528979 RepID=A0ABY1ZLL5_9GAMM|nr:LuxR C-terminal-related transcriptional regulator [Marinobacter halodurans]TBW56730.1 helix-turn-helix transcriptional regulator [Marinobacter halodurans]